jgi:hypothetical protein
LEEELIYIFSLQNPLKLANEIVGGHFGEIDQKYSNEMWNLVHSVLEKVSKDD